MGLTYTTTPNFSVGLTPMEQLFLEGLRRYRGVNGWMHFSAKSTTGPFLGRLVLQDGLTTKEIARCSAATRQDVIEKVLEKLDARA